MSSSTRVSHKHGCDLQFRCELLGVMHGMVFSWRIQEMWFGSVPSICSPTFIMEEFCISLRMLAPCCCFIAYFQLLFERRVHTVCRSNRSAPTICSVNHVRNPGPMVWKRKLVVLIKDPTNRAAITFQNIHWKLQQLLRTRTECDQGLPGGFPKTNPV